MTLPGALVIVDVQRCFYGPHGFSRRFLARVWRLARTYRSVYQVWDSVDADGPDFRFPNEVGRFEKSYGFDIGQDSAADYLEGPHLERWSRGQFDYADRFDTKDGRSIVFVGAAHEWFMVDGDFLDFLKGQAGKTVDLAGGAQGECLEDVQAAMEAFGVNYRTVDAYP